jgi:hypothetical protein
MERQDHGKLAALARTVTARTDASSVQVDQAANDGKPDAEAACRTIETPCALHEGLEQPINELPSHADAVITDIQGDGPTIRLSRHLDVAPGIGVLGGVGEQVRDDLCEPGVVAVHEPAPARDVDVHFVPPLFQRGSGRFEPRAHDVRDVQNPAVQLDFAMRDTGNVQQIVHEVDDMTELAA